ncbi:hypothetical protein E1A90_16565 [Bacillus mycoides]|nr:hypothetical protein E1A90_16565 [Bacillus mycoides]
MPKKPSAYDGANSAVRVYLIKITEIMGYPLLTNEIYSDILENFEHKCAYCGESGTEENPLEMEHLFMANRFQLGLQHPGNVVPAHKKVCNSRHHTKTWNEQIENVARIKSVDKKVKEDLKQKIDKHLLDYEYPNLDDSMFVIIKNGAEELYNKVVMDIDKSIIDSLSKFRENIKSNK